MTSRERNAIIVKTGIIGIAANVLLASFKAVFGYISNSIAITLDAVNNLSDAMSSIITIVGTKLSEKPADKEHPLGYGRIEYLSAMIISSIVLFAGGTSLVEAVKKIIHPETATYTAPTLVVIIVAIGAKILLGTYTKKKGEQTNSDSLIASGADALFDAVVTLSTLVGAAVNLLLGKNIEGFLGAVISVVILKAGFEMLIDTLDNILGRRIPRETSHEIKRAIQQFDGVQGVYDLFLENYGPNKYAGSVHIEVLDTMEATEIARLTRQISAHIYQEFGTIITCGIYAINTKDEDIVRLRNKVARIVKSVPGAVQIHAFSVDKQANSCYFDVVRDFSVRDEDAFRNEIESKLTEEIPEISFYANIDLDYSD